MSSTVKRFNIVKIILNKSIFDENIIHIILKHYWQLLDNKRKVLLSWIDIEYLCWINIYANPNAIDLIKERIQYEATLTKEEYNDLDINEDNKIDWIGLSSNPNAIELLTANQDKIDEAHWKLLDYNNKYYSGDLPIPDKIYWDELSRNQNAIELLTNNQDKISWGKLSVNPTAIDLLKKRIEYENSLSVEDYNNLRKKIQ